MYIIAKQKGCFRAIPIQCTDKCRMYKMRSGKTEYRIILKVCGRKYVIYSTCGIRTQYPDVGIEQLETLCNEIMRELQIQMRNREDFVDVPRISEIAEKKNVKRWMEAGLLPITSLDAYCGHPIDPATQQLVAHLRVEFPDVILMDCEPPADVAQEELPY